MINQTRFFTTEKANIPTNIANGTINANDLVITSDTHELYFVDENNNYFPITTTKEELGINNVTNDAQIKGKASGTTENHVLTWGVDGYTVKDSGYTINKSVPANAVFTDTTYVTATTGSDGLMSAADKIKLDGIAGGTLVIGGFSYDDDSGNYTGTSDKTWQEIHDALAAGKRCVAIVHDGDRVNSAVFYIVRYNDVTSEYVIDGDFMAACDSSGGYPTFSA